MIIAELWDEGECIARWAEWLNPSGPPGLEAMIPRLREQGWDVYDFREEPGE